MSVTVRLSSYLAQCRQLPAVMAVLSFAKCMKMDLRQSSLLCSWTMHSTLVQKSL